MRKAAFAIKMKVEDDQMAFESDDHVTVQIIFRF